MMIDLISHSHSDSAGNLAESVVGSAPRSGGSALDTVTGVNPNGIGTANGTDMSTGENGLQVTTGIFTGVANAAVRMHLAPVFENFWAYCPKTKTRHFQHRKVANLS